jgi:hypothetical protein
MPSCRLPVVSVRIHRRVGLLLPFQDQTQQLTPIDEPMLHYIITSITETHQSTAKQGLANEYV